MKVAALYDIHGNLPALEAVLEETGRLKVDNIVVGGDVVLGPMSRGCMDKLLGLETPVTFIKGNCEVAVLEELDGGFTGPLPESVVEDIRWTAREILPGHQREMARWPMTYVLEMAKLGKVLFCHATPRNENENFTKLTPEENLLPVFGKLDADLVVCGHTHMQFDRKIGNVRVVNAGSVGMPFGRPGAYWLLLGPEVGLRHTYYDMEKAAERIKGTAYPHAHQFAEGHVKNPPTEEAMLKILGGS